MTKMKTAVIKIGGDLLLEKEDRQTFATNLKTLRSRGWQCVLMHGGGPQLNRLQALHSLEPRKIEGRRITGEADLLVVKQALCGEVNVDLVSDLQAASVPAFGFHGASGAVISATKRPPMNFDSVGEVDLGLVGDVKRVNTELLTGLLNLDLVPVIASLGISDQGEVYNINADTTAAAVATAMNADALILSTKVGGVYEDIQNPETLYSSLNQPQLEELIQQQIVTDGMIPKLRETIGLLAKGVGQVIIADAAREGIFDHGLSATSLVGTRLLQNEP